MWPNPHNFGENKKISEFFSNNYNAHMLKITCI